MKKSDKGVDKATASINPCLDCRVNQQCCSRLNGLRLTNREFDTRFRQYSGELLVLRYRQQVFVSTQDNNPCPYWCKGGCNIYEARPIDCRIYPFEIKDIAVKKNEIKVEYQENPGCPHVDTLLMPKEKAKSLIENFCQDAYGHRGRINVQYRPGKKVFTTRIFSFFRTLVGRLYRFLKTERPSLEPTKSIMFMGRGVKNALWLLWKYQWREFFIRLRISLGQIDLRHDPTEEVTERTHYYADSGGLAFDRLMAHFKIMPTDAIIDFGCGKGGILISLSKYPFSRITGVEISPALADIAIRNIRKLDIRNVTVECCDAANYQHLDQYNYFYFFDPFPGVVMQDVLRNIEQSIIDRPRKITIIYLNPFCHKLIEAQGIFTKIKELPHFEHQCFVYSNAV